VAVYKIIWKFIGGQGDTWSEQFYIQASSPSIAVQPVSALVNARLSLLDPTCTWLKLSVSLVDAPGTKSTLTRVVNWVGTNKQSIGPDAAGTAMVCNLAGTSGGSRKYWMRGIPNYLVVRSSDNGVPIFTGLPTSGFRALINAMAAGGYGMRSLQFAQKYPITSVISFTSAGQAVVSYAIPQGVANPNFQTGANVILSQADAKTLPGFKGVFQILTQVPNQSITVRYLVGSSAGITQNCGFLKSQNYGTFTLFNPDICKPAYWGTHSTRSTFSNSRGARRAVRIRTLA